MTKPLCTFGPPAERERHWILKFEDADVGDMHYTVEADAMRAWDRYKDTYTCTLFVTAEFVGYVSLLSDADLAKRTDADAAAERTRRLISLDGDIGRRHPRSGGEVTRGSGDRSRATPAAAAK